MNHEKTIGCLKYGLLAFVLVSIGFGLGKEWTLRRMPSIDSPDKGGGDHVVVYYVHATIRCVTCETIERLTHETLDQQFASEKAAGTLVFKAVNFQEDTAFAARYEIVANCVVVSRVTQGREVRHQRVDEVWELYEDGPAFKQFLGDVIRAHQDSATGGDA